MPYIRLETSARAEGDAADRLLASISSLIASEIGKPEQYVMAELATGRFLMSGKDGDAAFADIRSIGGLDGNVNTGISEKLCALLKEQLDIDPGRVYINFTNVSSAEWGWNGSTFG